MTLLKYKRLIQEYSRNNCNLLRKEADGCLRHPYIVPGSSYSDQLWDWDSWLTDIAIRQIMSDNGEDHTAYLEYERGSVLNFLENALPDGKVSFMLKTIGPVLDEWTDNLHKPCLAQHIRFILQNSDGGLEWIRSCFPQLRAFIDYYMTHCRHKETGLYFWMDDGGIGVDNDPCTYYRPPKSSGSIYLNCMMYQELLSTVEVLEQLGEEAEKYREEANHLRDAMHEHMWDERNGFYYSVDFNLLPIIPAKEKYLHSGAPRHYDCLIQRIDVWTGFMTMWAGIATKEQAERMVRENLLREDLFWSPYGVRTLSPKEKMYRIVETANPSNWHGPIWGIANYMCFEGLVKYGYYEEATELAERTIRMLGQDIEQNGAMHEFYDPETGEGLRTWGFQSWNLLANNMIAWLEGR